MGLIYYFLFPWPVLLLRKKYIYKYSTLHSPLQVRGSGADILAAGVSHYKYGRHGNKPRRDPDGGKVHGGVFLPVMELARPRHFSSRVAETRGSEGCRGTGRGGEQRGKTKPALNLHCMCMIVVSVSDDVFSGTAARTSMFSYGLCYCVCCLL